MAKSYCFTEEKVTEHDVWPGAFWLPNSCYCIMSVPDYIGWVQLTKSFAVRIKSDQVPKHIKMQALVLGIPLPKE